MDQSDKNELIDIAINALEELKETDFQFQDVRRAFITELSKALVYNCFRNGPIEDIHAGEECYIPETASRITNDEMANIMKTATTQVADLLEYIFIVPNIASMFNTITPVNLPTPSYWEDPDWENIDEKRNNLRNKHQESDKTSS